MAVNQGSLQQADSADASGSPFDNFDSDLDAGDETTAFGPETPIDGAAEDDGFDPFKIAFTAITKRKSKRASKPTKPISGAASVSSKGSSVLPPRLDVKFKVHEELSSGPSLTNTNEGACDVYVSGTVLVRTRSLYKNTLLGIGGHIL
jgi:hypothetical protein